MPQSFLLQDPMLFATGSNMSEKKLRFQKRWRYLEQSRQSWISQWQDISRHMHPRRGEFLTSGGRFNTGRDRHHAIVDNRGIIALQIFAAGMFAGLTSPSLRWFSLRTKHREFMEYDEVRQWLEDVNEIVYQIIGKSNFYEKIRNVYMELGAFGTAALYREPTYDSDVIRFFDFTCGEYALAQNKNDEIDTLGRCISMSVKQIVERFVKRGPDDYDFSRCSNQLISLWEAEAYDEEIDIVHLIMPRTVSNPDSLLATDMPYASVWFEYGGESDMVLHESGYDRFPAYVSRWSVDGHAVYGSSPAMNCLGDLKQLQQEQKSKSRQIENNGNPPYKLDSSLRNSESSVVPGGHTYVRMDNGNPGIAPLIPPVSGTADITADISETHKRIEAAMYTPLFAQFVYSSQYGDKMTAAEVARRHSEQLTQLSPMYNMLNRTLFSPMIQDVITFAGEQGLLPPPPAILMQTGETMDIEYVSSVAKSLEATNATGIERGLSLVGNLSGINPDVLDIINFDETIKIYLRALGFSEKSINDEDFIVEQRQARAEQEQAAQMMEGAKAVQAGAAGVKSLSEAQLGEGSVLQDVLGVSRDA